MTLFQSLSLHVMKKIISSVFIIAGISFSGFAQPYLIKDIWPGISSGASTIFTGIGFQNHMYFPAYDSLSDFEPWITDGTTNGTYRLYDINPGTTSSNPNTFLSSTGMSFLLHRMRRMARSSGKRTEQRPAHRGLRISTPAREMAHPII